MQLTFRLFGIAGTLGTVFGLVTLFVVFTTFVRLFPTPALVALTGDLSTALRQSWRRSRGHWFSLVGVVVLVGVAISTLGQLGYAGTFLSTALVAPIHAVALVVFVEATTVRTDDSNGGLSLT